MEGYRAIRRKCGLLEPRAGRGDLAAVASLGKLYAELGLAADAPLNIRETALLNANKLAIWLSRRDLHNELKSMLSGFVHIGFSDDQPDDSLRELGMSLLQKYAESCSMTRDNEKKTFCCQKALSVAEKYGMTNFKCVFHYFLGLTYLSVGEDLNRARKELDQLKEAGKEALQLNPELGAKFLNDAEDLEGQLELLLASSLAYDVPRSAEHCEKAIKVLVSSFEWRRERCRRKESTQEEHFNMLQSANRLGNAYYRVGNLKEAYTFSQVALKAAKDFKIVHSVANAAICCGTVAVYLGENEAGEGFFREGLQYVDSSRKEYIVATLYAGLGKAIMSNQDRLHEAVAEFRIATNILSHIAEQANSDSSLYRISYLESTKTIYNDFQHCLYELYSKAAHGDQEGIDSLKEALIICERGRCRDLVSSLEENLNSSGVDKLDWKKFDKDKGYAWEHLESCMRVCTDAIKKQKAGIKRVTFVEYTLLNHHLLIWVLHSNGTQTSAKASTSDSATKTTDLPSMFAVDIRDDQKNMVAEGHPDLEKNLEDQTDPAAGRRRFNSMVQTSQAYEAVRLLQNMIEKLKEDDVRDSRLLVKLYKLLIMNFASKLHPDEPVVFIPHEALSLVPFAALMPKKTGAHFIVEHPIGISPSLRVLGWTTTRYAALSSLAENPGTNPMLFVADPSPVVDTSLRSLPSAVAEVDAVTRAMHKYSIVTLKQEKATLRSVTSAMKLAPWLHIACHGERTTDHYPQGVLFLGRSAEDDGCLTYKIISDDVGTMVARAAVLSACKAGQGKQMAEGQLDLARAFIQVGVTLVIAPLPQVNSARTSAFMQHLYDRMLGGESVMFALQKTMVDAIEKRIKGEGLGRWKLWDWAAWQPVGFPAVCLPSANSGSDSSISLHSMHLS